MPNANAVCDTFKLELLTGVHNFTPATDVFKIALYNSTSAMGNATTIYTTSNEITGTAYTAGGLVITSVTPTLGGGSTAYCDFNPDAQWTTSTITARGALIYNSSKSNKAIVSLDFGSDKISSAGDFVVQFPPAAGGTAIIRIA